MALPSPWSQPGFELSVESAQLDRVVDSLRNLSDRSISMEGLGSSLKRTWERIVRLLKLLYKRLRDFFSRVVDQISILKESMRLARYRFNSIQAARPKEGRVGFGNLGYQLMVDGYGNKTDEMIGFGLREVRRQTAMVREKYLPMVESTGTALLSAIRSDAYANPEGWLIGLNKAASTYKPTEFLSNFSIARRVRNITWAAESARQGTDLPGMKALVAVDGFMAVDQKKSGERTTIEIARAQQTNSIRLENPKPHHEVDAATLDMKLASPNEIGQWLGAMDELIKELETSRSLPVLEKCRANLNALESRGTTVSSASNTGDANIEAGLRYISAYASWVDHPYTQMLGLAVACGNSALSMINRHTAQYR